MTPSEINHLKPIFHPLTPWDDEGHVWVVTIQRGEIVDDPVLHSEEEGEQEWENWSEIRVRLVHPDGPIWQLEWSASQYFDDIVVYQGLIPDHQLLSRLFSNAVGIKDYAHLLT